MKRIFSSLALLSLLLLSGCGGGDSAATQTPQLTTLENTAFTSTHFSGSQNCASCHNNIKDNTNADVSIESDWAATIMANSSKDPLWKAKVASELERNPHLEDVILESIQTPTLRRLSPKRRHSEVAPPQSISPNAKVATSSASM